MAEKSTSWTTKIQKCMTQSVRNLSRCGFGLVVSAAVTKRKSWVNVSELLLLHSGKAHTL